MPYDQWYDDATREAATARVLQRKMTNPTDRNVLTVVAEEFNVPRQTLSDWVDEASPEPARPARKPRPKFSQVVRTSKAAPDDEPEEARVESPDEVEPTQPPRSAEAPQPAATPEPPAEPESRPTSALDPAPAAVTVPEPEPEPEPTIKPEPDPAPDPEPDAAPPAPTDAVAALEAEVAALRAGNRALIEAMRVLLDA